MINNKKDKPKVIPVKELLNIDNLQIPEYQRPYKWTLKNVNQLIDDILFFNDKNAYRLGTLVLYKEQENGEDVLNIVDGQQRTITLWLIAHALLKNNMDQLNELKKKYAKSDKDIEEYKPKIAWSAFSNSITKYNLRNNYLEIERRIQEFDADTIYFFFEKCEFVRVTLTDISEAFQFFDSQNARGKDLDPHDLLKAFHLREMNHLPDYEKKKSVAVWEEMVSEELSELFSKYLFRIRNWGKSHSARFFTKNDVDIFKGISPNNEEIQPYARPYRIVHYYIDHYNEDYNRNIDLQKMDFPFQLDQVIINGKRFFEFVSYYKMKIDRIKLLADEKEYEKTEKELMIEKNSMADEIIKTLMNYEGKDRTGDKYVRNLFECALIYYLDKFGLKEVNKVIEKLFIWAYSLRLNQHAVQIASMDNHALNYREMFKLIREATHHKEIVNMKLEPIKQNRSSKTETLTSLFKQFKYYDGKQ